MTEYLGWDNYVKEQAIREQEEYILGPIIRDDPDKWLFNQLNDRVTKLENSYDKVILDRLTKLEAHNICWTERVKDLEEWLNNGYLMDRNNIGRRLKDLDEWKVPYANQIYGRLNKVEEEITKTAQYAGGLYADLEKKVKDLEEQNDTYHEPMMTAWNHKHDERIEKLEEWKGNVVAFNKRILGDIGSKKTIDKKVWENIKFHAAKLDGRNGMLKDAIKQADPSWVSK